MPVVLDALALELEILKRIPPTALKTRPPLRQEHAAAADSDVISFACAFYSIKSDDDALPKVSKRSAIPFVTAFEDIVHLSTVATKALLAGDKDRVLRDILLSSLIALDLLVDRLDQETNTTFIADWEPTSWLSLLLQCLEEKVWFAFCCTEVPSDARAVDCWLHFRGSLRYGGDQDPPDGAVRALILSE